MNFLLITLLTITSLSANASVTSQENRELINKLLSHQERMLWQCRQDPFPTLFMFQVDGPGSAYLSGNLILVVQDNQVCRELNVTCPFVASVRESTFGHTGPVKFGYWAARGRYEDTVMFFSDGAGMKAVAVSNGAQPRVKWNSHWYFNPGECTLSR